MHHLWLLARLAAGLVALALLMYFDLLDLRVLHGALNHPFLLLVAAMFVAAALTVAALRWWLSLRVLGFSMDPMWSLRTSLISLFFNIFFPAHSGDVLRIAIAYREAGSRLSRLTFSVLVDHVFGFITLLAIGLVVLPLLPTTFQNSAYYVPMIAIIIVTIAAGAAGLVWGELMAGLLSRLPGPVGRYLGHVTREMAGAARTYVDHWPFLVGIILLSVLGYAFVFAALAVVGAAMEFGALSLPGYVASGVGSLVVNSVPLTPGGLGVGEAAFAQIATLLETAPSGASYATVFLAMRILTAFISTLGLVLYFSHHEEYTYRASASGGSNTDGEPRQASSDRVGVR
jgi:uncharacterized protein (TIRG00374 family)